MVLERDGRSFEPQMILIPAGEFLMGSNPRWDADAFGDEQPQHKLYLPDYYIAKAPVTNAQYLAFVQDTEHKPPERWEGGTPPRGREDHPVFSVSWYDAAAYCEWLSEATDEPHRLPSEAEWEKAARGTGKRIYPWGGQWNEKRCNSGESSVGHTTPVGKYSPEGDSPYGCVDMAGNVWEWTSSLRKPYPYDKNDGREDPDVEGRRVVRGGSWGNYQVDARCSYRSGGSPENQYWNNGFRVVIPSTTASRTSYEHSVEAATHPDRLNG